MKCPRCHKEIDNNSNFCPYCGCKLDHKVTTNKKYLSNNIILFIVAALCVSLISYNFVSRITKGYSLSNTQSSSDSSVTQIGEISEDATNLVGTYDSIEAFNSAYSNGSTYSKEVETFNHQTADILGTATNTSCIVYVYNDSSYEKSNVLFKINNTYNTNDMTVTVEKEFDVAKSQDQTDYKFTTQKVETFDELFFNDSQKTLIAHYVSLTDLNNIETNLYNRKNEFEKKKKALGHYGLGEYTSNMNDIIKKDATQYYKELSVHL